VAVAIDVGIDVLDRGAGRLQRRHGLADDLTDFGINWIEPEIGTVRDPKIVDRALRGRDVVGLVGRKAERIAGVGPGHYVEHQRRVLHRAGHRTRVGERCVVV